MKNSLPVKLVIFDCDGVLIDSEEISCRLIASHARNAGANVSDEQSLRFAGKSLTKIKIEIEEETGKALADTWVADRQEELVVLMQQEATEIDGASSMLDEVSRLGVPFRVASNSSMAEMDAKFLRTGLTQRMSGLLHSARDMGVPKPAPDVYIHAAAVHGISPENCIVLEDSDTGAMAARDAGMRCVMLRAPSLPIPAWVGLYRISHLREFAPLLEEIGISSR